MFGAIFRRAQATVDNAIADAVNRVLVIVPFAVALGFATAGLAIRLQREIGPEMTDWMLGGGFLGLGLIVAFVARMRTPRPAAVVAAAEPQAIAASDAAVDDVGLGAADRELLLKALAAGAPIALPLVLRAALRNLPLFAIVAIAWFILSQPGADDSSVAAPAE
jgi:hypothetical protein